MNIFKILANGGGSISETNVSSFLGYLLDPSEDHALGYEFIKRFLACFIAEDEFSDKEFYSADYQIFYEQAFKEEGKSANIVDLVIVSYTTDLGVGKRRLVHNFIRNTKNINRIYLIENEQGIADSKSTA